MQTSIMNKIVRPGLLFCTMFISACGINPVTGSSELRLISESEEIEIGQNNYQPLQQQQGGSYKVDPAVSAYVNQVGQKLVAVSDRKLPYEFVVLNNSVPNAWALPGGKIAINRGLLVELNNEAELAAVLGHEIVHAAARHSAKQMESGMALSAGIFAIGLASSDSSNRSGIMLGSTIGATLLTKKFSRDDESQADYYGMIYMARAGYDPNAAVSLQETFVRLAKGNEPNWLEGLFITHPPSQERVDANRETAKKLYHPGLKKGEKEFKAQIQRLIKSKDAYEKHDQARKALKNNQYAQASKLADEAIKIEPGEARFYALKGDIYQKQNNNKQALEYYNDAIERDSGFYHYYLQRGIIHKSLGHNEQARQDLYRSNTFLPTKEAQTLIRSLK